MHALRQASQPLFLTLAVVLAFSGERSTRREFPSAHGCTTVPRNDRATTASLQTADFVVTVGGSPSLHYIINGVASATLDLTIGHSYSFDLTAFGDEHPFIINSNATNPWGALFLPAASGTVVNFTPTASMPTTIYYHCEVHYGSMVGIVHLVPSAPCPGDMNGDSQVSSFDFGLFSGAFGSACANCAADIDHNGTVNSFDFGLFANAFGAGC